METSEPFCILRTVLGDYAGGYDLPLPNPVVHIARNISDYDLR